MLTYHAVIPRDLREKLGFVLVLKGFFNCLHLSTFVSLSTFVRHKAVKESKMAHLFRKTSVDEFLLRKQNLSLLVLRDVLRRNRQRKL